MHFKWCEGGGEDDNNLHVESALTAADHSDSGGLRSSALAVATLWIQIRAGSQRGDIKKLAAYGSRAPLAPMTTMTPISRSHTCISRVIKTR